jgi:hypothetical protein
MTGAVIQPELTAAVLASLSASRYDVSLWKHPGA